MDKSKKLQKLLAYKGNPSLATFAELVDLNEGIKNHIISVKQHKELLDSLEKWVGEKGEQGIKGEKGDKGDKGDQGIQGIQGIPGKNGIDGKNGRDGKDGLDGLDGKDGKNHPIVTGKRS